jgi:hypothetical protein
LKKCFFSSNIIKTPSPQDTEHRKKRKKRRRKSIENKERKLQESPQIKGEVNILRGEKHFNFKISFLYDSIFSPSIILFEKPFLNH